MTYTIRDNNGNVVFSVENSNPTTPEVSFESIDNKLEDLNDYSNKLSKSIEVFNLISDTRAMEALGYVKGAGFKDNIKNVGDYIGKKIQEFFKKIYEYIVDFINKIKEKIIFLKDESELKTHVTLALKDFKLNKDFSNEEEDLKDIHKKIITIYKDESLRKTILFFTNKNNNMIIRDRDEAINIILKGFEYCEAILNIIGKTDEENPTFKNKVDTAVREQGVNIPDSLKRGATNLSKLKELSKNKEWLEKYKEKLEKFEEIRESINYDDNNRLRNFAIDFISYLSNNRNSLSSIKKELSNLNNLKNKIESFEKTIDNFKNVSGIYNDEEFEKDLNDVKKYILLILNVLPKLISEITKEETAYVKIMRILN